MGGGCKNAQSGYHRVVHSVVYVGLTLSDRIRHSCIVDSPTPSHSFCSLMQFMFQTSLFTCNYVHRLIHVRNADRLGIQQAQLAKPGGITASACASHSLVIIHDTSRPFQLSDLTRRHCTGYNKHFIERKQPCLTAVFVTIPDHTAPSDHGPEVFEIRARTKDSSNSPSEIAAGELLVDYRAAVRLFYKRISKARCGVTSVSLCHHGWHTEL